MLKIRMEKDDEIKGAGNSLNYEYRMHDPRLGRFFAIDPLAPKYPHNSPYAFSENRVIDMIELEGLEKVNPQIRNNRLNRGGLLTVNSGGVRTLVVGHITNYFYVRPPLTPSTLAPPQSYARPLNYDVTDHYGVVMFNVADNILEYNSVYNVVMPKPLISTSFTLFGKENYFQRYFLEGFEEGLIGSIEIVHVDYYDGVEFAQDSYGIKFDNERDRAYMNKLKEDYAQKFTEFSNELYKASGYDRGNICIPCTDKYSTIDNTIEIPIEMQERAQMLFKYFFGESPDRLLINAIMNNTSTKVETREIKQQIIGNPE